MRKRSRKYIKLYFLLIIGLFAIPFVLGYVYVQGALYIINDITSFTYKDPYEDFNYNYTYIEPNFTKMEEWAHDIELRFEKYHMPANISLSCTFSGYNYTNVTNYHHTDNVGLSTGFALATESFRYQTAKNENDTELLENATRAIKRLVTGFSYLLAVPNGGIGPNYSGIISRFYWSPENTKIPGYQSITDWMLDEDEVRHFNGTGEYKNYRWRGYTSKDEMAGYLFGLGCALQYCDDSWVQNMVKLLIAQIVEGFLDTNWLVINGDGHPAGSDMKSLLGGGEWILSLLQLARHAYPDRYTDLYHYFASKNLYMNNAFMNSPTNLIMDYYAWNFEHKTAFNLITMEDDPNLKNFYINRYEDGIYNMLKTHRNPYFNMMYLVFTAKNDTKIKTDIFDQLMRFENNSHIRNINATKREDLVNPHQINPAAERWNDFINNNPLGSLYYPLTIEINFDKTRYLQPATVDMLYNNIGNFYERNPFEDVSRTTGDGLSEGPGNTFTCVYWMGRAHGIIPPP
jgi:hypothetical protein